MNVVDFIILGVIVISVIFGLYKGFVNSVFSLLALFVSLVLAYTLYPSLANTVKSNDTVVNTLVYYSDASSRIHDLELASTPVDNIPQQVLDEVMSRANLPEPFDTFVRENVAQRVFAPVGSMNISDYLNQTIIDASINILCFLACFLASYILLTLLIHLLAYVFTLPVLKHFDMLLGGAFGAVRGIFFVFVLFALVPIIITVSPIEGLSELIDNAQLSSFFYRDNLITSIFQNFMN